MNLLNIKSILPGIKASQKGFSQSKVLGDPWQLGGVLLMQPSGATPYLYRSRYAGDHPNIDDVIQEIDACILVTAHDEFKKFPISLFNKMKHSILVDTRGVFDPLQAESAKLTFRGLGRGK